MNAQTTTYMISASTHHHTVVDQFNISQHFKQTKFPDYSDEISKFKDHYFIIIIIISR